VTFIPLNTPKEIVVYRGGWGFSLPDQHEVSINADDGHVDLHMPQAGGVYELEGVEETDDETRVHVAPGGPIVGSAMGTTIPTEYPFPTIDIELQRLRARWENAGGPRLDDPDGELRALRQRFEASAQGDDFDRRTERMRAMIRELSAEA
jgi:hypothetical protein